MTGSSLRARLDWLERKRRGRPELDHGWGESRESIERRILDQPRRIAERAVELREEVYDRGGWLETELTKISGEELAAHEVAVASLYGPEAVPTEWRE